MTTTWQKRWGGATRLTLGAVLTVFLAVYGLSPADEGAKEEALPADLAKIPRDAGLVTCVRLGDVWDGKLGQAVRRAIPREMEDGVRSFRADFGMAPEDVERWTYVFPDIDDNSRPEQLIFVLARKARPTDKLFAASKEAVSKQQHRGQTFWQAGKAWAVWPLDDRSFVYGSPQAIRELIDRPLAKNDYQASVLRLAAGRHTLVTGLNVKALRDANEGNRLLGMPEPLLPLLDALWGTLTLDVDEEVRATAALTFASEKAARDSLPSGQAALDFVRDYLKQALEGPGGRKERAQVLAVFQLMRQGLKETRVEPDGKTLRASGRARIDLARVADVARETMKERVRLQIAIKLRQLGVALHDYHDTYGHFPLRANFDKNGKPLLSWRVQLLPYVGEQELYKEFRLDEPWDSEHNKKLLPKMPKVYASPQDEKTAKEHTTHLQVFIGKGTVFDGKKRIGMAEITKGDGTSNTLFLAEAAKAVPWTKPEDMPFEPDKPLPRLGLPGADGFHALFCDGHVSYIRHTIKPKVLECLITWNDGTEIKPGDIEGNE